jgi:hypothetical protein
MGPAFYVMAILGCGEAEAACEPVGITATQYESVEACTAETAAAIERHMSQPYPVVVAQCQKADSTVVSRVLPEDVKLPEPRIQQQAPRIQRAVYSPKPLRG